MKTLNPKWLYAAISLDANDNRFGTIFEVNGDNVVIYSRGVKHTVSAKELDKTNRLIKHNAVHLKYI